MKNTEETTKLLKRDVSHYLQEVAGIGCPPECPHFPPLATKHCDSGCQLAGKLHPWDCLEASVGDLSRYLVGIGWVPPASGAISTETHGRC